MYMSRRQTRFSGLPRHKILGQKTRTKFKLKIDEDLRLKVSTYMGVVAHWGPKIKRKLKVKENTNYKVNSLAYLT